MLKQEFYNNYHYKKSILLRRVQKLLLYVAYYSVFSDRCISSNLLRCTTMAVHRTAAICVFQWHLHRYSSALETCRNKYSICEDTIAAISKTAAICKFQQRYTQLQWRPINPLLQLRFTGICFGLQRWFCDCYNRPLNYP